MLRAITNDLSRWIGVLSCALMVLASAQSAIGAIPVYSEQRKLTSDVSAAQDGFGVHSALHNNLLVTSASYTALDGQQFGRANGYDVRNGDLLWTLTPPSPFAELGGFSQSLAATDEFVAGGQLYRDAITGNLTGLAHIFSSTTGQYIRTVFDDVPNPENRFGLKVAIDGSDLLVGGDTDLDYFDAASGLQHPDIPTPEPGVKWEMVQSNFDVQDGEALIVGTVGIYPNNTDAAAYLMDLSSGAVLQKFEPDVGNYSSFRVTMDEEFVALSGSLIFDPSNPLDRSGVVFVFDRHTGEQLFRIDAPNPQTDNSSFGNSIDMEGGLLVVGSPSDGTHGVEFGATYTFDAATGAPIAELLPSDGLSHLLLGLQVLTNGEYATTTGFPWISGLPPHGALYIFVPEPLGVMPIVSAVIIFIFFVRSRST
ncbi:MAG: hypothetical protein AB7G28_09770 [Pirellulales bacterium]